MTKILFVCHGSLCPEANSGLKWRLTAIRNFYTNIVPTFRDNPPAYRMIINNTIKTKELQSFCSS